MKRFSVLGTALSAALVMAGCATAPNANQTVDAINETPLEEGYILTRIADSSLPAGECGMILWTLEDNRPEPIFRYVAGQSATLAVNGTPVELIRQQAEGARAFGIAEAQAFTDETQALQVTVASQIGLGFDGGAYLERGLITIENKQGWRTVTPAAGIAGCRAQ